MTVTSTVKQTFRTVETYASTHFIKIAYTISVLILAYFSTASFVAGSIIGLVADTVLNPTLKWKDIRPMSGLFAMMGALACLVSFTPAGRAGGLVFQSIPFFCSISIGTDLRGLFNAKT